MCEKWTSCAIEVVLKRSAEAVMMYCIAFMSYLFLPRLSN
jgi:hypothetical protein